jgi:hypothetical protein
MIIRALSVAFGIGVLVVACGSEAGSDGDGNGGNGSNGSSGPGFGTQDGGGGVPGELIGPACATSNASGLAEPMTLVFMFDRSGSMKFNPTPNNKWDSVVAGMTNFYKDARSANLFASLDVFPLESDNGCNGNYQTPIVGVTALPDTAGVLANALGANGPNPNFGTPTTPALAGSIAFAKTVEATGKKVAVVLVTDGQPQGCNNNSVNDAANAAGAGLPGVRTYVIGIGPALENLKAIAVGGGTTDAIIISTTDPNKITADFVAALGQIRTQALTCDYALPSPPSGETLDINRVNVQYTTGAGKQTLKYNGDCADGEGWHYDNPSAPTRILICPKSCDTLLADASGKIDIVFGCSTVGSLPK